MEKLNERNELPVDLPGKNFETKVCQTSTHFLTVLKSDYGTEKLAQILNIICEKYPEGANEFGLDCAKDEKDSLRNAEYFKELLLKNADFYEKFVKFCFEENLILQDENDPHVISKEVILGVSKQLKISDNSYLVSKSKESAYKIDTKELRKNLEISSLEDMSEFLTKLFGRFANIYELEDFYEKNYLNSIFESFFRFPSSLSDKEIKEKQVFCQNFLQEVMKIKNGKLWIALFIKYKTLKHFQVNPFPKAQELSSIEELSETDNGQFLLATMVDNGIVNKGDIPKGIKEEFHPQVKADVLTLKDRIFGV